MPWLKHTLVPPLIHLSLNLFQTEYFKALTSDRLSEVSITSQSMREKRKDFVQALLIVGGIIGGFFGSNHDSPELVVLLVVFMIFVIMVYSDLMQEGDVHPRSYSSACFGLSLFFGLLFGAIFYLTAIDALSGSFLIFTSAMISFAVGFVVFGTLLGWDMTGRKQKK